MQLQPDFTDYFHRAHCRAMRPQNPDIVKVRWVDVPWADMQSKILTAVTAGTAPDVVNLNPDFAVPTGREEMPGCPSTRRPQTPQTAALPAQHLAGQQPSGATALGMPWYLTTRVTLYNQDLLAEAAGSRYPPDHLCRAGQW
jgi:putative chitobiose transport system substrate-binding protein